jgi:hypothetical protein
LSMVMGSPTTTGRR